MTLIDNFNLDHITPLTQVSIQKSEDNNENFFEIKSNMCIGKPNTEEIKKQIMFIKDALYIKNNINMSKEQITEKEKLKQKILILYVLSNFERCLSAAVLGFFLTDLAHS